MDSICNEEENNGNCSSSISEEFSFFSPQSYLCLIVNLVKILEVHMGEVVQES